MRELLFGGILYLIGIAIILVIKPSLFFMENGHWKEFGIGRNPKSYTWMPFWLFCIFWGIVSYSTVYLIIRALSRGSGVSNGNMNENTNNNAMMNAEVSMLPGANTAPRTRGLRRSRLPPASGYYVLRNDTRNNSPYYEYYSNNGNSSGPRMTRY